MTLKNLELCIDHKQEWKQSHYSPDNCDYCKLIKEREKLERVINRMADKIAGEFGYTIEETISAFSEED